MPEPAPAAGARLTGAALRDAKIALRRQVLGLRDALPADVRSAAGAAIAARVGALPSFMDARTLLLTLPFRSEWDTMPLVAAALAGGRTLALPRVDPHARMLSLHAIADADRDVAPGYRGIPEPRAHCAAVAPAAIDWVLVPGVAFDPAGGRLGYGGGYYDRLLPLLSPRAARVAGAFDVQVVASVPAAPHDLRVDLVVTETHTFRCPR